ncbi:MAG: hypothetical protein Q9218_005793, partial [Villophora microphyllina]
YLAAMAIVLVCRAKAAVGDSEQHIIALQRISVGRIFPDATIFGTPINGEVKPITHHEWLYDNGRD